MHIDLPLQLIQLLKRQPLCTCLDPSFYCLAKNHEVSWIVVACFDGPTNSGIGREVKRANRIAAVASANWLYRAVPATVERIWAVVAGSRSSFSSNKARVRSSGGALGRSWRAAAPASAPGTPETRPPAPES